MNVALTELQPILPGDASQGGVEGDGKAAGAWRLPEGVAVRAIPTRDAAVRRHGGSVSSTTTVVAECDAASWGS
jgi:hypothetical protein